MLVRIDDRTYLGSVWSKKLGALAGFACRVLRIPFPASLVIWWHGSHCCWIRVLPRRWQQPSPLSRYLLARPAGPPQFPPPSVPPCRQAFPRSVVPAMGSAHAHLGGIDVLSHSQVVFLVFAGPHSIAGACAGDRSESSSADGKCRRQQATHRPHPNHHPMTRLCVGICPVTPPAHAHMHGPHVRRVVCLGVRYRFGRPTCARACGNLCIPGMLMGARICMRAGTRRARMCV